MLLDHEKVNPYKPFRVSLGLCYNRCTTSFRTFAPQIEHGNRAPTLRSAHVTGVTRREGGTRTRP